ncbi:hypothetical protein [Azospirillum picis]|uniref:Holin of 3TMs, for gene-transfer release n=1 Tax=Azospirillum picis TaxID=488438 RepID=A0ABU0MN32_9PROT|nr:hypothetical protein [Azospirillum picis]MBP2301156.1 hypothetical protein [Azospirillum picis]MDQ0534882.1 hypothetical protein [Azospirillum picis]
MLPLLVAAAAPLAELAGEEVARLIAGDDPANARTGAAVAQALVTAAGTVTGFPVAKPEDIAPLAASIAADPAALAEFRKAVADRMLSLLALDNGDRANARGQTVDLAKAGSRIAWGAPLVSFVVLVTFGVVLYRVLSVPAGQADPNASLMLGALTTMATAVVSYWVGSSAGSAAKDKLLRGK